MKKLIGFLLRNIPRPWLISASMVFGKFASFFYRGDRFICPVCNGRFRKMLPYGYNEPRENALCPGCLSLERHRLLWLYLQKRTRFFSDHMKVLHIAPEQCFYKRFRKMTNLTYLTADLESPIADIILDVQNMPFVDNDFDIVICNHVLEHVQDDRKALAEIFRVLKRGGFAILQVPLAYDMETTIEDPSISDPAERQKRFRQKDHYRLYGKDYLQRVMAAGFAIGEENFLLTLSGEEKDIYRLPPMEFMYGYLKP